jgi:hypothetical protein
MQTQQQKEQPCQKIEKRLDQDWNEDWSGLPACHKQRKLSPDLRGKSAARNEKKRTSDEKKTTTHSLFPS